MALCRSEEVERGNKYEKGKGRGEKRGDRDVMGRIGLREEGKEE